MSNFITRYFEAKKKAYEVSIKESEMMEKIIEEASDVIHERPTDGGWTRSDQVTDQEKGHLQPNQHEMVRQARSFYRWNSMGRAAIQTLVNYIMGNGLTITPKSKEPLAWWIWREFWTADRNSMELKQFELSTRLFRDGEVFIQFFDRDEEGKGTGKTTVRFIDPLLVRNPGGDGKAVPTDFKKTTTKSGIEHDSNDIERVIRYWVMSNSDSQDFHDVLAKDMLHIKIFSDSDQKRGETLIQPVMKLLRHYGQWLENRILLNKMRTAIVMIKEVSGTPAQVSQLSQTVSNMKHTRSGVEKKQQLRGGTIITANPGVKYKMESPNINAADVKDDGREMKLNIAAGMNLPEYALGDVSNANYASTLIAEAPFVKSVEYWQITLEFWYKKMYKMVMERGVEGKIIDAPNDKEFLARLKKVKDLAEVAHPNSSHEDEDDDGLSAKEKELKALMPEGKLETPSEIFFGCDMQWPEVVHRDVKAFTESLVTARESGWISDQSASAALGYDLIEEIRKQKTLEDDGEKNGNPLLGIKSGGEKEAMDDGDLDKEANDIINNLSDEERNELLGKIDPKEVVSMLMAKAGANGGNQNGNAKTGAGVS